jgi:hypothetical protein
MAEDTMPAGYEATLGWPGPSPPSRGPGNKQEFLDAVKRQLDAIRRNPKPWKVFLLQVKLHPSLWQLDSKLLRFISDNTVMWIEDSKQFDLLNQVRTTLEGLADDLYKRDKDFRRMYYEERVLAKKLHKALDDFPPKSMEPFLLEALLISPIGPLNNYYQLAPLAQRFVHTQLPKALAQAVSNSKARESQYALLGAALLLKAKGHQNQDPLFRKKVEEERKKRKSP